MNHWPFSWTVTDHEKHEIKTILEINNRMVELSMAMVPQIMVLPDTLVSTYIIRLHTSMSTTESYTIY